MAAPTLVTYATKYGSTHEVAEAVAKALRERGLNVEIRPVGEVQAVDGYGAVVLGAPLYMGSWLKEAGQFLTRFQAGLTARPVAVFMTGPLNDSQEGWKGSREAMDKQLAAYPWLKPVATELLGGSYDPAKLSLLHKIMAVLPVSPLKGLPASDARDWTAIRVWASDLAAKLQPGVNR